MCINYVALTDWVHKKNTSLQRKRESIANRTDLIKYQYFYLLSMIMTKHPRQMNISIKVNSIIVIKIWKKMSQKRQNKMKKRQIFIILTTAIHKIQKVRIECISDNRLNIYPYSTMYTDMVYICAILTSVSMLSHTAYMCG